MERLVWMALQQAVKKLKWMVGDQYSVCISTVDSPFTLKLITDQFQGVVSDQYASPPLLRLSP